MCVCLFLFFYLSHFFHSLSLCNANCLILSLPLSHFFLSVFLSVCLFFSHCLSSLCLSPSLSFSCLSLSLYLSIFLSLPFSLSLSLSLSLCECAFYLTLSPSLSLSVYMCVFVLLYHFISVFLSFPLSPAYPYSLTHTFFSPDSLSLSLSLSLHPNSLIKISLWFVVVFSRKISAMLPNAAVLGAPRHSTERHSA